MNHFPCLCRSSSPWGEARFALGDPLVDSYLEFVAGRSRPNTLRDLPCPDDPGVRLHTLASLTQQLHTSLAAAINEARRHDYTPDETTQLLGTATAYGEPLPRRSSLTRSHV